MNTKATKTRAAKSRTTKASQTRRPTKPADLHRQWLELVDAEGPFLAAKALAKAWPHGMPTLEREPREALTYAAHQFERAWDAWQSAPEARLDDYRAARDEFVDVVLRDVFGWHDSWHPGAAVVGRAAVSSPRGDVTVRPTGAVELDDRVGALVWVVDPGESLRSPGTDGWSESAVVRMELMLREAKLPIGLVTDSRWWALVSRPADGLPSSGVVDSQTWVAEPAVRDAVAEVLSLRTLFNSSLDTHLPAVFAQSQVVAEDITDALGVQVRKAVELLVAALDEAAATTRGKGEPDPLPDDGDAIYEAVVTVVMRLVFLLFAEERGLLPQSELYRRAYGMADQLDELTRRQIEADAESLDRTYLTWHRLLATSTALHGGVNFEDLRLPAYGGSLFDPARFPFLGARTKDGTLALRISDLVMLHALRSVQTTNIAGEGERRVSFRDIDVEQIGYIYEGLLGYTCKRAASLTLGLIGTDGAEPEMELEVLEDLYEDAGSDAAMATAIADWVKKNQPAAKTRTTSVMTKALRAGDSAEDAEQALRAVADDQEVRTRLRGWLGIIRRDLRNRPMVVHEGGWLVVETPSRKNAGAHYTPRALAEEVVLHALEPLVHSPGPYQTPNRDEWRLLSSDDLLDLKVADIACGSGAFLVAAARYLGDRLVEAWQAEGRASGHTPEELEVKARREVVAQCLYGADINGMAVEMCKLSLWLVSLDPGQPFSFVDDKVFHGNSLLGLTDLKQLQSLHIQPKAAPRNQRMFELAGDSLVATVHLEARISDAAALRRRLASEIDERDPQRSAAAKRGQLERLHEMTRDLETIADGVIAAGLAHGGKPGKALDEAYENLRVAVTAAFPEDGSRPDRTMLDAIIAKGLTPTVETDYDRWQPLHWCLAVPDVMARGGFDAVVGNPPFLGGKKVSGAMSTRVREWLVNQLAQGSPGNADLVAYFFLRAAALLKDEGALGLIATNTIAQGDTREVGLDRMVDGGFTITRAIQSRSWPARSANLEFAGVWGTRAVVAELTERLADEVVVTSITTLLEPAGRVGGRPSRLTENQGIAFIGCNVNGEGFVLSETERRAFLLDHADEAGVIRRYLNGQDINARSDGSASRYVFDFDDLDEIAARSRYPAAFALLKSRVYDYRRTLTSKPALGIRWWRYERNAAGLRPRLSDLSSVLAIALVSKSVMPLRVPTGQVFSHALSVFATDSFGDQAVLSSSLHQMWAIKYGSGMRSDPRYTPSDVFETFPRPASTPELERIGRVLDEERRETMLRQPIGLTKLYNLVNDPDVADADDSDVARMRAIHTELDHVVMDAYGWGDVELDHGFHTYRQMTRWTVSPAARVEILDRLLEENHRRAALQGYAPPPADDETTDEDES